MNPKLSLRWRIFLSYFMLVLIAAIAINAVAYTQILNATNDAFVSGFEEKVDVVSSEVEDVWLQLVEDDTVNEEVMLNELAELADELDVHVTLLELDGQEVLYDTSSDEQYFETELTEEVIYLLLNEEPLLVEYEEDGEIYRAQYVYFEEEPWFIIRVGESWVESQQQAYSRIFILIGTTGGIGLLLVIILGSWLANTLTQPLVQLRTTAQTMAQGNLHIRANTELPSELHLLAQDFNRMATAVEKMVAEQKAFASNTAHELRTPLTAMRLRTEILLEDDPDPALQQRYIGEIHTEVERLSHLVSDLRLLSQVDAQSVVVGHEQVDIAQLLETLEQEFAHQLAEKQLTYTITLTEDRYVVQANHAHMRIILRNVIENAIKYTPKQGAITVSVKQFDKTLQMQVKDNGMGIPAEALPNLFNRFYRVDKARNRKISGTGLGLSLVHSILSLYQGTIEVQSDGVGQGTCVTITLPLFDFRLTS